MAISRKVSQIVIYVSDDGSVNSIEVVCDYVADYGDGRRWAQRRGVGDQWADLGPAAKTAVQDFVDTALAYLNQKDPLS
jgi:hypothetical protein